MSEDTILRLAGLALAALVFGPLFYWLGRAIFQLVANEKENNTGGKE